DRFPRRWFSCAVLKRRAVSIRAGRRGDHDARSQQSPISAAIPLLQDTVDACLGRAVGGGLANELRDADANAFRFHSDYGGGLPSGSLDEGVFDGCHELASRNRQLRKARRAVELVESAQQIGLFQRHGAALGTSRL